MRRPDTDGSQRSFTVVQRGSRRDQVVDLDHDSASSAFPPVASSSVAASGVTPVAWNMATAPEEAAAAQRLEPVLSSSVIEPHYHCHFGPGHLAQQMAQHG